MAENSPFGPEDLDEINQRLKELDTAEEIARRARQAGIDVEDKVAEMKRLREQLMRLKQSFFPGR